MLHAGEACSPPACILPITAAYKGCVVNPSLSNCPCTLLDIKSINDKTCMGLKRWGGSLASQTRMPCAKRSGLQCQTSGEAEAYSYGHDTDVVTVSTEIKPTLATIQQLL